MSGAVEGVALMPCPFCGGPASIYQNTKEDGTGDYDPGFYFVRCDPCDLIHDKAWCVPHAEAIAAWNTRTTPPARSYADEDVARIIDPLAWQERERLLVRKAEWESRPVIEGVDFVAIYARDADAQVAPSLAKAAAIRLLSQGGKA